MIVKIYGHGGQGVDTARKIIGKAALLSGFFVQDFIIGGLERRPANVYGYVKFDKNPILSKQEELPDFVLIFDKSMINEAKDIKENGMALINADDVNVTSLKAKKIKAFHVDVNSITATTKSTIPNIVMLGAFTKLFDKITMKNMKLALQEEIGESKENLLVFDEGYKNVKRC